MEEKVGYVYFIKTNMSNDYIKIGKAKDYLKRIETIGCYIPLGVSLLGIIKTNSFYSEIEMFFHNFFKDDLVNNEWFNITFDDIISCINKHLPNKVKEIVSNSISPMDILNKKTGKMDTIKAPGVDRFYRISRKRSSFEWDINISIPSNRNRIFFYDKP